MPTQARGCVCGFCTARNDTRLVAMGVNPVRYPCEVGISETPEFIASVENTQQWLLLCLQFCSDCRSTELHVQINRVQRGQRRAEPWPRRLPVPLALRGQVPSVSLVVTKAPRDKQ